MEQRGVTRQQFLVASAGAATGLLLSGCGSSGDGATTNLTFWNGFTGGDGPQMLALIDEFSKKRRDVSVDMVTVRWEDYYLLDLGERLPPLDRRRRRVSTSHEHCHDCSSRRRRTRPGIEPRASGRTWE